MKIILALALHTSLGGLQSYTNTLKTVLEEHGHKVIIFTTKEYATKECIEEYGQYYPRCFDYGKISKKELLMNIPKFFYNKEAENKLTNLIKEQKPDLIHHQSLNYYFSPSVINASYNNNIPTILHLHTPFPICPGRNLMQGDIKLCKDIPCAKGTWNALHCIIYKCFNQDYLKSTMAAIFRICCNFVDVYEKIDFLLTPSNAMKKLILKSNISRRKNLDISKKIIQIENFLSYEIIENTIPFYDNEGYFLYAGRLHKTKGLHTLIRAMSELPHITLKIAGSGPLEAELREFIEKHGMTNIEFLGCLEGAELYKAYKKCIAMVYPSNCFEAFGISPIESYAFGKPVITTRIGALPEVVHHQKTGLVITPDNSQELAEAISLLYTNPDITRRLGESGYHLARELYSPKIHYEKIMTIYKRCVPQV